MKERFFEDTYINQGVRSKINISLKEIINFTNTNILRDETYFKEYKCLETNAWEKMIFTLDRNYGQAIKENKKSFKYVISDSITVNEFLTNDSNVNVIHQIKISNNKDYIELRKAFSEQAIKSINKEINCLNPKRFKDTKEFIKYFQWEGSLSNSKKIFNKDYGFERDLKFKEENLFSNKYKYKDYISMAFDLTNILKDEANKIKDNQKAIEKKYTQNKDFER